MPLNAPQFSPIPEAGLRGDDRLTFTTKTNAFLGHMNTLETELQTAIDFVAEAANQAESDRIDSQQSAETAKTFTGLANYQGTWVAGSYSLGKTVNHSGSFWISNLNQNTSEPGVDINWSVVIVNQSPDQLMHPQGSGLPNEAYTVAEVDAIQQANIVSFNAVSQALDQKLPSTGTAADSSKLGGQLPAYYQPASTAVKKTDYASNTVAGAIKVRLAGTDLFISTTAADA